MFAFLLATLLPLTTATAAAETWVYNTKAPRDFTLDLYVIEGSKWSKPELQARMQKMNEALRSCGAEAAFVNYHEIDSTIPLPRVDDLDSTDLGDGMQALSKKFPSPNPRLFYFDDYLESFTSGATYPLAVFEGVKGMPKSLNDTAWFPFLTSARREKRELQYSEEAHELGHVLLRRGHDFSDAPNVLTNNSALRLNSFTPEQCAAFHLPKAPATSCEKEKQELMPIVSEYFLTYRNTHYMATWCVRNSKNLYGALERAGLGANTYAVLMIHRDRESSIFPMAARWRAESWSNHGFLVKDGLALDLDFTEGPAVLSLEKYLDLMWGEQDIRYQVRPAAAIDEFTNLGVRRSFDEGKYPEFDRAGLLEFFRKSRCANLPR